MADPAVFLSGAWRGALVPAGKSDAGFEMSAAFSFVPNTMTPSGTFDSVNFNLQGYDDTP